MAQITVKGRLLKMLTDNGMFDNDAEAVFDKARESIEGAAPDYKVSWDRPADEYPEAAYMSLWPHLKTAALAWIEENKPAAWYRPMFE